MITSLNLVGAGSRGIRTLGALQYLNSQGFKPDMLFGCSSGGLNAFLYAQGQTDVLADLWMQIRNKDVRNFRPLLAIGQAGSIYDFTPLRKTISGYLSPSLLRHCPYPVWITLTDLSDNETVRYAFHDASFHIRRIVAPQHLESPTSGVKKEVLDPVDVLIGSASVPVYVPRLFDRYVDGGVMSNYNLVAAAQAGADRIIVVHPNVPQIFKIRNILDAIDAAITLQGWGIYQAEKTALKFLSPKTELIEIVPQDPLSFGLFDFDFKNQDRAALIRQGFNMAKKAMGG